jgi:hypothetical protein
VAEVDNANVQQHPISAVHSFGHQHCNTRIHRFDQPSRLDGYGYLSRPILDDLNWGQRLLGKRRPEADDLGQRIAHILQFHRGELDGSISDIESKKADEEWIEMDNAPPLD